LIRGLEAEAGILHTSVEDAGGSGGRAGEEQGNPRPGGHLKIPRGLNGNNRIGRRRWEFTGICKLLFLVVRPVFVFNGDVATPALAAPPEAP
jgi:hypothetical protein